MLSPKYFGLIIGVFVFFVFIFFDQFTPGLRSLEIQTMDFHLKLKTTWQVIDRSSGATEINRSARLSDDIVIVGVDNKSLEQFGRWPFPRSIHADLLNTLTRIKQPEQRESAVMLDFLFNETSDRAYDDVLLLEAMKENGRVSLQTLHHPLEIATTDQNELNMRLKELLANFGEITNIGGDLSSVRPSYGIESPLIPYGKAISAFGHASYSQDPDGIYRRQELVSRYSIKTGEYKLDDLKVTTDFGIKGRGHLSWVNNKGAVMFQELPLNKESLEELVKDVRRHGLTKQDLDTLGDDGNPVEYHFVSAYEDHYVPAISLTLALQYLNKDLNDLEVVYGSHILIPSPERWDVSSGTWIPYSIPTGSRRGPAERVLEEIRIPIDESGYMLVNFMGRKSSSNPAEYQTFPVRSYYRFAAEPPGHNQDTWKNTQGFGGKVVMVGAFTLAMADDEKPSPLGLMFGVEIHANALNTIIMDNFIAPVPPRTNQLILLAVVLIVAFITSRIRALGWSVAALLAFIVVSFVAVNFAFDIGGLLFDWSTPVIAAVVVFVANVIYRVITAERDKRKILNVFGQFISPELVEDLAKSPPELGGVDINGTVMFSDIRGFSALSEGLPSSVLVDFMNVYLTAMTDNMVIDYKGTLDKYIGDAIMAFWGAPKEDKEHAVNACKSAVAQIRILNDLNHLLMEKFQRRIDIGIGINSGFMNEEKNKTITVAYMGSEGRKNYTAMGDPVNLASRLEGVNKEYDTSILISEDTYRLISHDSQFIVRELDLIRVKGRTKPVTIYELLDYEGELKGVAGSSV